MYKLLLVVSCTLGCSVSPMHAIDSHVLLNSTHIIDADLQTIKSENEGDGKRFVYGMKINDVIAQTDDISKYVENGVIYVSDYEQGSSDKRLPPHHEEIQDLKGRRVVVFLGCEDYLGVRECSFSAHDADVIQEYDEELAANSREEWSRTVPEACGVEDEQLGQRVRNLIDKLAIEDAAQSAADEIIEIGKPAVPYLIKYMNDRRRFAGGWLVLASSDSDTQYRPEVLLDAIAALLGHITGKSMVFVYNGGVEEKVRENALKAWRYYGVETYCPTL